MFFSTPSTCSLDGIGNGELLWDFLSGDRHADLFSYHVCTSQREASGRRRNARLDKQVNIRILVPSRFSTSIFDFPSHAHHAWNPLAKYYAFVLVLSCPAARELSTRAITL